MSMGMAVTGTTGQGQAGAGAGTHASNGGRLVALDGRVLPLRAVSLRAEAAGGIARVTLTQRFANPHAEPMQVTYSVPLPVDAAVAGYAFLLGDRRIVGEVDRRSQARARFENAVLEGRSAALLDQERANLFTQELGNVPPGTEVTVELTIDQRLRWLSEGAWEWRFPTVAPPRYLGGAGRVADAAAVTVDVADGPTGVRAALALAIGDALAPGRAAESPTHHVIARSEGGALRVSLPEEGAALDRDVVVRWAVAQPRVGCALVQARPAEGARGEHGGAAYGLLTIVPPAVATRAVARDLCVLLDTSGSMGGTPLAHARRVVAALIDGLREEDRLEMIAFSSEPEKWKSAPVAATAAARAEALSWLNGLSAGGGTEMASAVTLALKPLRADAQRQVVLVTDGHIGFEQEVVREVMQKLPAPSRLHTVGVGSSVNRALTGPAARAGRGVEVVVDLDEDAERGAARLVAATRAPLVVELVVEGDAVAGTAPRKLPDLLAGAPALLGLKLRADGGALIVRGRTADGPWDWRLTVSPTAPGEGSAAVTALFGREAVEDLEMEIASGAKQRDRDEAIARIGLEFQIATRLTSWVAVSQDVTVDPRAPVRRETMPQELPYGLSAEGLGLRPPAGMMAQALGGAVKTAMLSMPAPAQMRSRMAPGAPPPPMAPSPARPPSASAGPAGAKSKGAGFLGRAADALRGIVERTREAVGGGEDEMDAGEVYLEAPAPEPAEDEPATLDWLEEPAPPETGRPEEKAAARGAPKKEARLEPRVLRGKRIGAGGRELVLEAAVEGAPLDWAPDAPNAHVELVLADGTRLLVALEAARTTRSGVIAAGASVRLAVALPPGVDGMAVVAVELESGGRTIRIELA
jgi:Ca-activated chloride channel family protein